MSSVTNVAEWYVKSIYFFRTRMEWTSQIQHDNVNCTHQTGFSEIQMFVLMV